MAPLSPETVTSATRIMLPAYVCLFVWIGLNYLVTPRERLDNSPTLAYADRLADLRAWGIVFLAVAALLVWSIALGSRTPARYALILASVALAVWTIVFFVAVFKAGASPSAPAWPFLGSIACFASNRSLTRGELGPTGRRR